MKSPLPLHTFNGAQVPSQATPGSAGLDLVSPMPVSLIHGHWTSVPLGLRVQIPEGYVGLMKGRSGLAFRHGVIVYDGTIDSDYRGELSVLMKNEGDEPIYFIHAGDRIAQLLIVKYLGVIPYVQKSPLNETERGIRGYGSSGR